MNKVAAFALQRKNSILSMSEKMFCPPQPLRLVWITPACAGKSSRNETCWHRPWDHPCVCREKRRNSRDPEVWQGSPPPVRGKVFHRGDGLLLVGITPACAGKKGRKEIAPMSNRDHPRVCGEKPHPASDRKLGRVRGTKRSSGPAPAAAPAGLAGSYPASPPWSYPPRITVSRPRP